MSRMAQEYFAKDSWQTPGNARTLRAFMALRQAEIGQRIAQLRASRGNPPQEIVAQEIGVSYRSLQMWEAGETKPGWRNLTKLADYFGVSEEYILVGEIDPNAPRHATQLDRIERELRHVEAKINAVLEHLGIEATTPGEIIEEAAKDIAPDPHADESEQPPARKPGRRGRPAA